MNKTQTIGILGAGTIGAQVARYVTAAGRQAVLASSRPPAALAGLAESIGLAARAGTAAEAADAGIVVLAVPWPAVEAVLAARLDWGGRILVDATNAIRVYDPPVIELYDFGDRTSSQVVADTAAGARVVKAFNTLPFPLFSVPPATASDRRVMFLCGDDPAAKSDIGTLLDDIGYAPVDLGSLAAGSVLQQAGGPLAARDLRLVTSS